MDVRVVLVCREGLSDADAGPRTAGRALLLAGRGGYVQAPPEAALAAASEGELEHEYVHFLTKRTIVLPSFYTAVIGACEHNGTDYAFCYCADLASTTVLATPTPDLFVPGQLVVRSWVLEELGVHADFKGVLGRVLSEYRGTVVPHVLCVEVDL